MMIRRDLRRRDRRPMEGRVIVTWETDGQPMEVRGSCRDISDGGVGVFVDHPIPKGAYVGVRNRLSGLRRSGRVRHSTRVGSGFRLGVEAEGRLKFRYS